VRGVSRFKRPIDQESADVAVYAGVSSLYSCAYTASVKKKAGRPYTAAGEERLRPLKVEEGDRKP
jgi:hypothetical protein